MKKVMLTLLVLGSFIFSVRSESKKSVCKITITVTDSEEGKIQLRKMNMGNLDTLEFKGGKLSHEYEMEEPMPMYISDMDGHYQVFFADPKSYIKLNIELKSGLKVTLLEGSKSNEIFRQLISKQEPVQQAAQQISQQYQNPKANKDSIANVIKNMNVVLKDNFFNFLKEHGGSEVAAFVVYSSIMNERSLTLHVADTLYQFLREKAKTGFYGKELAKTMEKLKSVEIGYTAPNFTLADSSGKNYTLRNIKSKYTLVDFWASWCGPCKAEIPFMKKAYEQFHAKGFEIVSVSIDAKREAWLAALNQFQMPWIHLLETEHIVSDLYHFPTIPKTILIDQQGKIIAADLRGETLEQKLKELLP